MKLPLLALCLGLLGACGESNVCQQACQRQKSCGEAQLAKLDCNDPQIAPVCDMARKALAVDCSQATDQACTGDFEAESRRTASCDLDPLTCTCPRNVCLEVCRDQKDCAESSLESIDCAASNNQQTCAELQQMLQKDCYAIADASCVGALKTEAEQIDGCFLDHTTCTCLTR